MGFQNLHGFPKPRWVSKTSMGFQNPHGFPKPPWVFKTFRVLKPTNHIGLTEKKVKIGF
jgi:hypothetical protein